MADKNIQDVRPEPRPGHPYLQSARITVPAAPTTGGPRLQKGMLSKVKQLLADLGLPPRPLPTKVRGGKRGGEVWVFWLCGIGIGVVRTCKPRLGLDCIYTHPHDTTPPQFNNMYIYFF